MSGPPRLIDLSIARSVEHAARSGKGVGTDDYMSPEQCDPDRFGPVGPASDIWGLGVSLYQAATGELPFTKGSPDERWPVLHEDVKPFAREVPEAIATPLLACLEKSSPNRPTAADLHDELEPLLTHLPQPRLGKLKPRMRPRARHAPDAPESAPDRPTLEEFLRSSGAGFDLPRCPEGRCLPGQIQRRWHFGQ
ncbi:MAG: protein kinase [Actinobacteria bacterium]|nr:protein kinase [Actinomycetota bacterium]